MAMEKDNKCKGIGGLLFGHKFQSVYETENKAEIDPEVIKTLTPALEVSYKNLMDADYDNIGNVFEEVFNALRSSKRIFVHHICTRCGKTITK